MAVDNRFGPEYREAEDESAMFIRNEIITGPVSDWATDFSHLEPEWSEGPYPIQDDLRQRCPIARSGQLDDARRASRSLPGGTAPSPRTVPYPSPSSPNRPGARS